MVPSLTLGTIIQPTLTGPCREAPSNGRGASIPTDAGLRVYLFGSLPEGEVKSIPTKEPKKLAIALMSFFA